MENFKINIPQKEIDFLKQKLQGTRFTKSPENSDWHAGADHEYLKNLHKEVRSFCFEK